MSLDTSIVDDDMRIWHIGSSMERGCLENSRILSASFYSITFLVHHIRSHCVFDAPCHICSGV